MVAKIVAAPRTTNRDFLWYGLTWGAPFAGPVANPFSGLANTTTSGGKTVGAPFPLVLQYLGTWVQQNPTWDWTTTTYDQFDQLFQQSVEMFGNVMGTDNPDLSGLKRDFARLIWHTASPRWDFEDATFDRSAASFDNSDHVDIVIHNYRWRLGAAEGASQYDHLEARLATAPVIGVPSITLEGDANGAPHPDAAASGTTCRRKLRRFLLRPYSTQTRSRKGCTHVSRHTSTSTPPTVVFVHGAFADASSWTAVIQRLQARGVQVTAPANPLRGISIDSAYIASVIDQISGPVLSGWYLSPPLLPMKVSNWVPLRTARRTAC